MAVTVNDAITAAITEYNARMSEVNDRPALSGPGAVPQYDSHAVPTRPEGGEDDRVNPCPDCTEGVVLDSGAIDPRATRYTCSHRCGWEA